MTETTCRGSDNKMVRVSELAKMYSFCSNEWLQKSLGGQITEGLQDGNTIQELLQIKGPNLDSSHIQILRIGRHQDLTFRDHGK